MAGGDLVGRSSEPMTVDALAEIAVRRISVGSGMQRAAMATIIDAAIELTSAPAAFAIFAVWGWSVWPIRGRRWLN